MELRPILSAMRRNKFGALLIAAQMAVTLAFLANALTPVQWYMQAQRFRLWFFQAVMRAFADTDVIIAPATPVPAALPEVVWRAGLDLAPIDVTDDESVSWLESLIWPGEGDRLTLLRAAVRVAREDPPRIVRGDLRRDLPALALEAPERATLVVFHTAVLGYVWDAADRRGFADTVRALGARWIANEVPGLIELEPRAEPPRPGPAPRGEQLVTLDGVPLAWADSHGAWLQWLA